MSPGAQRRVSQGPQRPLTEWFGVELDLPTDASNAAIAEALRTAVQQHHLVVVRGLGWDNERQIEISSLLGTLLARRGAPAPERLQPHVRYEAGDDDYADRWHADGSWSGVDALSLLFCTSASAGALPTVFLDTSVALPLLPSELRDDLHGRRVTHDVTQSRKARPAGPDRSAAARLAKRVQSRIERMVRRSQPSPPMVPVVPVVVPEPVGRHGTSYPVIDRCQATGLEFLRLGDHAYTISGLSNQQSGDLIGCLHGAIELPQTTWAHEWREGDLLVFDNRMMLHRRAEASTIERSRLLRRTMVAPRR